MLSFILSYGGDVGITENIIYNLLPVEEHEQGYLEQKGHQNIPMIIQ